MRNLEKKQAARKKALTEIDKLRDGLYYQNTDKSSIEFYHLVQEYFADYSGIRYEFTYAELLREIRRKKVYNEFVQNKVKGFVQELQNKEYNGKTLTQEELTSLLREFKAIVLGDKHAAETGILNISIPAGLKIWMAHSIRKFGKKEVSEIMKYSEACDQALSKSNLSRAQDVYLEMEVIYDKLGKKEQQAAYPFMKSAYSRIDALHTNVILQRLEKKQEEFYRHLEAGDLEKAAMSYNQAKEMYEELSRNGKNTIYREMTQMHNNFQKTNGKKAVTNIERALNDAKKRLKMKQLAQAEWAYSKAQKEYENLPSAQKKRVYPQIREIYKRISC
ncbi:MAG: hypothetical protein ABIF10_07360 [Candidatus Woesearchaeota archaeon]